MAACNTETILARTLNGRYARAGDEAYALIREALHASGDITINGSTLHIRLDPLSAPRRTRALAALCATHNPLPRNPSRPSLRSQGTPSHYLNYCAMPGALVKGVRATWPGATLIASCQARTWRSRTTGAAAEHFPICDL